MPTKYSCDGMRNTGSPQKENKNREYGLQFKYVRRNPKGNTTTDRVQKNSNANKLLPEKS
jgi:hypothetical protein